MRDLYESQWRAFIYESDRYDADFLADAERRISMEVKPHTTDGNAAKNYFKLLYELHTLRDGAHLDLLLQHAVRPQFAARDEAVRLLLQHRRDDAVALVTAGLGRDGPYGYPPEYEELVELAKLEFSDAGGAFFRKLYFEWSGCRVRKGAMKSLITNPPEGMERAIHDLFVELVAARSGKDHIDAWVELAGYSCAMFDAELRPFLTGKSKRLREAAAAHFAETEPRESFDFAVQLLASKKVDDRIGGVCLLWKLATSEAGRELQEALAKETSKQVRKVLTDVLRGLGVAVVAEPEKKASAVGTLAEFETALAKKPKSIKLPKAPWLDFEKLPPLVAMDGTELAELTTTFVIQKQARGNKVALAPELELLLSFLDRSRNAAFAHAVLDQWFASDQKANTQWALGLAGVTGDNSIMPRLLEPIEKWCQANRGAVAQWAVTGIGLLGTDEALTTLDGLINKFRSKRKYVGAAAKEAIITTAEMRGISLDELDDMIVPSFGFDADGRRPFESSRGTVCAVLKPDFKLGWFDPATEKETKSTPSTLTSSAKEDLKELRKFLRESVKAQTFRLERMMVQQRRWPVARWRELFEAHPLLHTFAVRLVWGVHDAVGTLLRTFRRYPNGLLADASGDLEELPESDTMIGLVHPLVLDAGTINAWQEHLQRFKVKPPFVQMDRVIRSLDPLHGNRKIIDLAKGVSMDAGSLRSRCEKRGWSVGATGDGGRINCFFKQYPAAGTEAYLEVDDFAAFSSYEDEVTLGEAQFARFDPHRRRAYLAEGPYVPDADPVLSFGDVPPVVYSETISDLEAIVEGQTS